MSTRTVDESDGKRKREEARRELDGDGEVTPAGLACSEAGTAPATLLVRTAASEPARRGLRQPWAARLSLENGANLVL